jgi:BASS family bile acid:Na+ symporter
MTELDAVRLNFSPESLVALNFILAFVMFGVALDMRWADFRGISAAPRAVLIGMASQFVLLPAAAWALTMLLRPQPSIALGLILVACCPGGNISNFFTHFSRGNRDSGHDGHGRHQGRTIEGEFHRDE